MAVSGEEGEDEEEEVEAEGMLVTDIGELVLPDGKVLGNRQYQRWVLGLLSS
jgi:hypothetical protein